MYRSNTTDFILSPVSSILSSATESIAPVSGGMSSYQLAEWIMPAVFLRMTGAQEQKLKCICWDLCTIDLNNRYQRLTDNTGGMSSYKDKNALCKTLVSYLELNKPGFNASVDIDKDALIQSAADDVEHICSNSLLREWYASSYADYQEALQRIKSSHIYNNKELLSDCLKKAYDSMYDHRNRCAHNNTVYQINLPKFDTMSNNKTIFENYFVRFFILILLDRFFVSLYKMVIDLADY